MKPITMFLSELRTMNVRLWLNEGQLHYKAGKGVLTPELLAQMKERKAEIITFLREANRTTNTSVPPIRPIKRDRDIPLSFAQQRLWFLYQLEGKSATYNIPMALRIAGPFDMTVLQQSIEGIVRRHEILRTAFAMKDGLAIQVIRPDLTISPTVIDLRDLPEKEKSTNVRQYITWDTHFCFDLMNDPLLRITLLRLHEEEQVLILVMHHIISDGWSLEIFIRELSAFVKAFSTGVSVSLPELPIQYADFAYWQREWFHEDMLETQLEYWKRQLKGAPQVLKLPTDRARPVIQTYRGGVKYFRIKPELTGRLKALSQQSDVSLFMTLFAAFVTLLFRYSSQKDMVIGTHTASRERLEIEPLIGFFINTLALRVDLSGNPGFQELLARVRQVALDGFSHQDIPFEKLVEALQPERDMSHAPLVQVAFVLQNMPIGKPEIPGVSITLIETERFTAKFDLSLLIEESEQELLSEIEYNSDLFDAAAIIRMVNHFLNMLEAIVAEPQQRISDIPLLSESELRQMLVEWNNTSTVLPEGKCIHQIFESRVERIPEKTAVVDGENAITYRQLNIRANQLAYHLMALEVGVEMPVGICMERSIDMLAGILGILKAGGAYVPLDPDHPRERLAIILADSQMRVVLTQKGLADKMPLSIPNIICLDSQREEISQATESNPEIDINTNNLAYIIYTSGSTGTPKGVMIEQHSVINLVSALENTIYGNYKGPLRFSLLASIVFDASVQQIFGSLLGGHTLYIVDAQTRRDGEQICRFSPCPIEFAPW